MASADIYVHLDDAQFSKGSFTNRIQIKHPNGIKWMTVPLKGKGQYQPINRLEAADRDWKRQHRELVCQALSGAPFFQNALDLFDRAYEYEPLIELLTASVEMSAASLAIKRPSRWLKSSELGIRGSSSERVLSIVKAVGGARYVTAHGAANYLDHQAFEAHGVSVEYADYSQETYPQLHGNFTPYVSVLDLVANLGPLAGDAIHPKTIPWQKFLTK